MDEARIVESCKRRDGKAQRQLYEAYADRMLPVCIRYMRHLPDAEDALVAGFFKFFNSVDGFEYRGVGSLSAFLKKIMINECLMRLRKGRRLEVVEDIYSEEVGGGEDLFGGLAIKEIFKVIAQLPDGYRTVFNLFVIEGYTHQQISAELGIGEGTSKSQLSKAKALLRQLLQQIDTYYARG